MGINVREVYKEVATAEFLERFMALPKQGLIHAPKGYWDMTPEQKKKRCNGCGPKPFQGLVPDRLHFLKITPT